MINDEHRLIKVPRRIWEQADEGYSGQSLTEGKARKIIRYGNTNYINYGGYGDKRMMAQVTLRKTYDHPSYTYDEKSRMQHEPGDFYDHMWFKCEGKEWVILPNSDVVFITDQIPDPVQPTLEVTIEKGKPAPVRSKKPVTKNMSHLAIQERLFE